MPYLSDIKVKMANGVTAATGASRPTVTLCGGFSHISGMEFLGQSEAKGEDLYKCKRLFNVRKIQKLGENFIITGKIIKSTSVNEAWTLRFDIEPETQSRLAWGPSSPLAPSLGESIMKKYVPLSQCHIC